MKNSAFIKPFKYQDFCRLFYSEIFFYIPAWMAIMVFGLIATHIKGNSHFYVGLIGFCFNIPMVLGPFIGVVIDRFQRITILKIASLFAMLAAVCMALLLNKSWLNFWIVLVDVLIYGFCCAFYYPAMLTGISDIIDDVNIIGNGISLANSTNRVMMFFGYGLGGILVNYFNEQSSFWFNAVSFLLSFLFLIRITSKTSLPKEKNSPFSELKSGLFFIKNSPPVFAVIILLSLMGLLAWPYLFQAPIVNRYYLQGTASTLGLLLAIGGIGGTLGAFLMSARKNPLGLNKIFISATIVLALSMVLLALCRSVYLAMPVLFLLDFCLMITLTTGIIIIQQIVPKEYLGRIMGIISMASFGTIPIGSVVFYGSLGEFFGVMNAFVVAAIILLLGAIWYLKQLPAIRQYAAPIFIKKGLLETIDEAYKI